MTYKIGKTLHADVFLGSHGNHWGLLDKLSRAGKGSNPFIDATTLPKVQMPNRNGFMSPDPRPDVR